MLKIFFNYLKYHNKKLFFLYKSTNKIEYIFLYIVTEIKKIFLKRVRNTHISNIIEELKKIIIYIKIFLVMKENIIFYFHMKF